MSVWDCNDAYGSMPRRSPGTKQAEFFFLKKKLVVLRCLESLTKDLLRIEISFNVSNSWKTLGHLNKGKKYSPTLQEPGRGWQVTKEVKRTYVTRDLLPTV